MLLQTFVFCVATVSAAVIEGSNPAIPLSWRYGNPPIAPPTVSLELQNSSSASRMFKLSSSTMLPPHVSSNIANAGAWHEVPDGRLWRVALRTPEAKSQSVVFRSLALPPGSLLLVYAPSLTQNYTTCGFGCQQLGAQDDGSSGSLMTSPIPGDTLVIEYFIPKWQTGTSAYLPFQVSGVMQGHSVLAPQMAAALEAKTRVWLPTMWTPGRRRTLAEVGPATAATTTTTATAAAENAQQQDGAFWEELQQIANGSWAAYGDFLAADASGAGDDLAPGYYDVSYGDSSGYPRDVVSYSYDDIEGAVLDTVGGSAACNDDAACDDGLQDVRRGVVLLIVFTADYQGLCTGNLINSESGRQFVLTAYHCLNGGSDKPVTDPSWTKSWVAVFNHGNECKDGGGSSAGAALDSGPNLLVGLNYVWGDVSIDMLLLEVMDEIPRAYEPYWLGWNARREARPTSALCVHHPRGDVKKVLYGSKVPGDVRVIPAGSGDIAFRHDKRTHWELYWSNGATAEGSSGAMLIDRDSGLLLGTLTGGMSSCNNDRPDMFSKLAEAWEKHGLWEVLGGSSPEQGMVMAPRNGSGAGRLSLLVQPEALELREGEGPANVTVRLSGSFLDGERVVVRADVRAPWAGAVVAVLASPGEVVLSADRREATISVHPVDDHHGTGRLAFDLVLSSKSNKDDVSGNESKSNKDDVSRSEIKRRSIPGIKVDDEVMSGEEYGSAIAVQELPFHHQIPSLQAFHPHPDSQQLRLGLFGSDVYYVYRPQRAIRADITACPGRGGGAYLMVVDQGRVKWAAHQRDEDDCADLVRVAFDADKEYYVGVVIALPGSGAAGSISAARALGNMTLEMVPSGGANGSGKGNGSNSSDDEARHIEQRNSP